jgi:hypothetical protein
VSSSSDTILENPYLWFEETWPEGRKTAVVIVRSKRSAETLGEIRWWGQWRQYVFVPAAYTVFNTGCMDTIIARIDELMERRKA